MALGLVLVTSVVPRFSNFNMTCDLSGLTRRLHVRIVNGQEVEENKAKSIREPSLNIPSHRCLLEELLDLSDSCLKY